MSEPSPAYLWYPKDVMSSGRVAALSALEELWYRRALDQSWLHIGMPADPKEFAGWVGRKCTVLSAAKIIEKFFTFRVKHSEKVFNKKQEGLRKELRRKSKERSRAGMISGRKRRQLRDLDAEQMLNKSGTNGEQKRTSSTSSSFPFSSSFSSFDLKRLIDCACAKNPKKDERLVEIAVLQTLMNRNGDKKPIKSIQYFSEEIQFMCSNSSGIVGSETIEAVLAQRRKQIQKVISNQELREQ